MINRLIPFIILLLLLSAAPHEYHFTHTKVVYEPSSSSLQISLKIPAHDLEKALGKQGAPDLNVGTKQEHDSADSLVKQYIDDNLGFRLNGQKLVEHFLGYELGDDYHDLWFYLEIDDVMPLNKMETMTVENTLFNKLYADQSNLVTIELSDSKQYRLKLNPDKTLVRKDLKE